MRMRALASASRWCAATKRERRGDGGVVAAKVALRRRRADMPPLPDRVAAADGRASGAGRIPPACLGAPRVHMSGSADGLTSGGRGR